MKEQQSGGLFRYMIKCRYVDWYNQTVASLSGVVEVADVIDEEYRIEKETGLKRKNITHSFLLGQNNFEVIQGELILKGFKIVSTPNSTVYFKLTSTVFDLKILKLRTDFQRFELMELNQYNIILPITMRPCINGEIFQSELYICSVCSVGFFSLKTTDTECKKCLENSICLGGNNIIVNHGFWRSSNKSSNVYPCQENEDNCKESEETTMCLNNFRGPLCRTCFSGFYKIDKNTCLECQSSIWNYFRIIGFIILLFILVIFLIKSSLDNNQIFMKIKQEIQDSMTIPQNILKENVDLQSLYIKIFVNYLQVLTIINDTPVNFSIPGFVSNFFELCTYFSSLSTKFIGFECIFTGDLAIKPYTRAISVNLTPPILILISIAFWSLLKLFKKCDEIVDKIIMTIVGIYLMLQPNILSELTKVLVCIKLDDHFYLRNEPIYGCEDELYLNMKKFFFLPGFFIWAYVFPIFVLIVLIKNRNNLNDMRVYRKMNFFYVGYKAKYYYWDILIFLRKSLIITLPIIVENPMLKLMIAMIIMGAYFIHQISKKPFLNKDMNFLEFYSNLFILTTIYCCMLLYSVNNELIQMMIIILIFISNVSFLLIWFLKYLRYIRKYYKPMALKIFNLIKYKGSTSKMIKKPPNSLKRII